MTRQHRFSDDEIERLLDKLATDDDFRAQLQSDPRAAFTSLGIDVDPSEMPAMKALPSKEQVAADRDALRTRLSGKAGLGIFLAF